MRNRFRCNALPICFSVVAVLGLASVASAQTVKAFQMVGFTSANLDGGKGVAVLSRECQLDFAASRMCTSIEVMNSVVIPEGTSEAWVRPVYSPFSAGIGERRVLDATGHMDSGDGALSCEGWSRNSSGINGLTVDGSGVFRSRPCNSGRRVACCALIPVPEPPTSMLRGGAVASLAAARLLVGRP